jgi:hypothetical protein
VTQDAIIEAARRAAEQTGGVLSQNDFRRITGISPHTVARCFPEGKWTEVLRRAGIKGSPRHKKPLESDFLLREFHRVVSELGKIPTWDVFESRASCSSDVLKRRFGGQGGVVRKYREWLESQSLASPVPAEPIVVRPGAIKSAVNGAVAEPESGEVGIGPVYGAPLDFRGLRHAPINEGGVIYLFGMVSRELGFLVEAVHPSFPDCEAKRCVDTRNDRWQRVRIEFEFRSSNFRAHGHDPTQCDLIVCWLHDWAACPLPVIELREKIKALPR